MLDWQFRLESVQIQVQIQMQRPTVARQFGFSSSRAPHTRRRYFLCCSSFLSYCLLLHCVCVCPYLRPCLQQRSFGAVGMISQFVCSYMFVVGGARCRGRSVSPQGFTLSPWHPAIRKKTHVARLILFACALFVICSRCLYCCLPTVFP